MSTISNATKANYNTGNSNTKKVKEQFIYFFDSKKNLQKIKVKTSNEKKLKTF